MVDYSKMSDEELMAIAGVGTRSAPTRAQQMQAANEEQGFFKNIGEGLQTGAKRRALGLLQLGMEATGYDDTDLHKDTQELAQRYRDESVGTGIGGAIGEVVGDPLTAALLPVAPAATGVKALAKIGAGAGLAEGLTSALTEEQGRAQSAAIGTATGLVGGVALGKASEQVPKLIGYLGAKIKGAKPVKLAKEEKLILARLKKDIPDEETLLRELQDFQTGGPAIVFRGEENLAGLAQGAGQYASARPVAQKALREATEDAPAIFEKALKESVSPAFSVREATEKLADASRKTVAPLYSKAYKSNPVVVSDTVNRILQTPAGKSALRGAATDMKNELAMAPSRELNIMSRQLDDAVAGQSTDGLSLQTLDYVKRNIDDMWQTATRQGDAAEARRLNQMRKTFVNALDEADTTGAYAKARATAADRFQIEDAMEEGMSILGTRGKRALTDEDFAAVFKGYNKPQQQAFRIGAMQEIMKQVRNVREGANPTAFLKNPAIQSRLKTALGDDYAKLMNDAEIVGKTYAIRNQVLGGSQTSANQRAAEAFGALDESDVADLATGNVVGSVIRKMSRFVSQKFDGINEKSAEKVTQMLFETNPKKRFAFAKRLEKAVTGQQKNAQARKELEAFFALDDTLEAAVAASRIQAGPAAGGQSYANIYSTGDRIGTGDINRSGDNRTGGVGNGVDYRSMTDEQLMQLARPQQQQPLNAPSIVRDEGLRLKAYTDTEGFKTVGRGFNLESGIAKKVWQRAGVESDFDRVKRGEEGITQQEANNLYRTSLQVAAEDVRDIFPDVFDYSPARQEALLNLSYQLGGNGLRGFTKMRGHIEKGQWTKAAKELLQSEYRKQTPNRANRVARALING